MKHQTSGNQCFKRLSSCVGGAALLGALAFAAAGQDTGARPDGQPVSRGGKNPLDGPQLGPGELPAASPRTFLIIPGDTRDATLYSDGSLLKTEWEEVWRPMCGSDPNGLTRDDLTQIAAHHAQQQLGVDANGGAPDIEQGGIAATGFTIIFNLDSSVPAAAIAAFDDVKHYLESKFDDPINVKVNVSFENMQPGVLGATGSNYTHISWNNTREALQDDMDSNDSIQNYLPAGSTIPVRYNGDSSTITNETRVFWTFANFRAAVGYVQGVAADMTFNLNFNWDYNPSNGVVGYSFQDVLIHEMGHVFGFDSGADFRYHDMEVLDIFRFQRTNGTHDYNPDTLGEFKTRARLVAFDTPNGNDDCNSDIIAKEYRMSDGDPYQCSHFHEQASNIGLMDPALANGETYYPSFYAPADLQMLDAIGYDR